MKIYESKYAQKALQDYKKQQKDTTPDEYFKKATHTSSPSRFLSEYQVYNEEHGIEHSPSTTSNLFRFLYRYILT